MAYSSKKPVARYDNADTSNSVVAEQQAIFVADAMYIPDFNNKAGVDSREDTEAAGEFDMDDDVKMELLDRIGIIAEEKDGLEKELERKADDVEKMKEQVQQLKNGLDQLQSEHCELHDFFEAENSSLLKSHEEDKSRFQEFYRLEKIELEETYRKQIDTLREFHEEEKTALQESHEEERSTLRALYEQEKETLQIDKWRETETLDSVMAEKEELQQENANVVEQLQNADLAKVAEEKQHRVLLDRLRDIAQLAQCRMSDINPKGELSQKKYRRGKQLKTFETLQNMFKMSTSRKSETATLEMLDADALYQGLTERINQLIATESKMHSQEEQTTDLRSKNEVLESRLSSLEILCAELSDTNEAGVNMQERLQAKVRNQKKELARLHARIQQQKNDQMDEVRTQSNSVISSAKSSDSDWESELCSGPGADDRVIVLCIDLSIHPLSMETVKQLINAILDQIEAQSEDKTFFSLVTHQTDSAAIMSGDGCERFHKVAATRQILATLLNISFNNPSYKRALEELRTVCDAAKDNGVSEIKIYIIGDGWTGVGSLEKYSGYGELETEGTTVRIWGFCLGDHSSFGNNECCFGILDEKCHHHSNGFNSSCILPLL